MKEVKPYQSTGSKKEQVRNMFDNISGTYDLLNRTLTLGIDQQWRKTMIKLLNKQHYTKIIDIATGTGDVAIALANSNPNAQIIGLDLSPKMLEIGKKKVQKHNLQDHVQMIVGDSENLPFEDSSFEAATVAFGVRNFEDLEKGLSEIYRILGKNGRLYILEFSKPRLFPFKQLFNSYFKYILPAIGRLTSKDARAYQYLFESVQRFPEGKNFLDRLAQAGFQDYQQKRLSLGICTLYIGIKS